MEEAHDRASLAHHAARAGDWWLVYLTTRLLSGRSTAPPTAARSAYATLVLKLDLAADLGN